jgi:4-hydroxybenzoate polyprenyltransferase
MLMLYVIATITYSLFIKKLSIIDVIFLAGFYTLRILAGGVAVDVTVSTWLLIFSIFFFFSLAFVKRYTELNMKKDLKELNLNGRDYTSVDLPLIQVLGPTSGYISVLVFLLYIHSPEVLLLYKHPSFLLFIAPCLLFWITHIWLLTLRGKVHDDPLIFTFTDKASYITGIIISIILIAASI